MKKVLTLFLALLLVFCFAACKPTTDGDTADTSSSPFGNLPEMIEKGEIDGIDAKLGMTSKKVKEVYADEYYMYSESQKGNCTVANVYCDPNIKIYYIDNSVKAIAVMGNCFGLQTGITTSAEIISELGANTVYKPTADETFFYFGEAPEDTMAVKYVFGENTAKLFFNGDTFTALFVEAKDFKFVNN